MSDKHTSVTSSNYSGDSTSVATASQQPVKLFDKHNMTKSAEDAQNRRKENKAAKAKREAEEQASKK